MKIPPFFTYLLQEFIPTFGVFFKTLMTETVARHLCKSFTKLILAIGFQTLLVSCGNSISLFDQYAYAQATSAKVDAMNVMSSATENYSMHKKEVSELTTEIEKIYEYEKNRKSNKISLELWADIRDTSKQSLYGFLNRWQRKGTLSKEGFIDPAKKIIGEQFDQIAQLEGGKNKK